jgi:hypothetical protein
MEIQGNSIDELNKKLADIEKAENPELDTLESESDLQSLSALGGTFKIAGIDIPPASIGVIMLLQIIDSPFIRSNDGISLKEIIEALFIMKERKTLVNLLVSPKRKAEYLARAKEIAEKSPAFYAEYLKALAVNSGADEYDRRLADFAEKIGSMKISDTAAEITQYLNLCMSGFSAVANPEAPDTEKKKIRPCLDDGNYRLPFQRD